MGRVTGAIGAALVGAAPAAAVAMAPSAAQDAALVVIAPGPLQQAIAALARQARVSIVLADPAFSRRLVRPVSGRMGAARALARMLDGSGLRALEVAPGVFRIVAAPAERPPRPPRGDAPDASPAAPDSGPPILVTATKRAVRLRDYAGPATVLDGRLFDSSRGAPASDSIAERVPALGSTHLGPGRDKLFIRAIADSSFAGQSQATVGQYLGEARLNYNAPDPALRLYDIAAVEILPGPQGTLYGAGSMGGVLRLVPQAPDLARAGGSASAALAASAHGGIGGEVAGHANLPLVPGRLAARLLGYRVADAGYIDDRARGLSDINRTTTTGARLALRAALGARWTLDALAVHQRIEGADGQYADRALAPLTRASPLAEPFANDYSLGNLTLSGPLGGARLLVSASRSDHRLHESFVRSPEPGVVGLYRQSTRPRLATLEARLTGGGAGGAGWLVGTQFLRARSALRRAEGPPDALAPLLGIDGQVDEQTLFAEATRPLTGRLSLTGGVRASHGATRAAPVEQAGGAPGDPAALTVRHWRLLPALAVGLRLPRGAIAYARFQQSYRPGGATVRSAVVEPIGPDRLSAWEIGLRTADAPAAPLEAALAASLSHWRDVQSDTLDTTGQPTTLNLGDGLIWSLDARAAWRPAPGLALDLSAIFNRSRVTNPAPGLISVIDSPLPNVPGHKIRLGIEHRAETRVGRIELSGWALRVGRSILGVGPTLGRTQGDYLDSGVELRLARQAGGAFVRLTNVFDTVGNRFALGSVLGIVAQDQVTPLRPRTLRAGITRRF